MTKRLEGAVVILSEADAEAISRKLHEVTTLIWDTIQRRKMLLREPEARAKAKVIPLRTTSPALDPMSLDDIF